ncbi:lactose transporter [Streptococcus oralis]|uniref:lactose transporter n=1 Tax=Streptococcus oralis TaxID=1303 RepID=UPI001873A56D|nr:lactose transporter [Streptococcus oralis]MCY7073078.1 lactose transporter [Streptococcus oralis]
MSEKRYYIKREGNHLKLSPQSQEEPVENPTPVQSSAPKRVKRSIRSMIGNFFSLILSGLIMVIGFLIATPFFLLSVLVNWVKMSIGFAVFWFLFDLVYQVVIIDRQNFEPFTNTTLGAIIILGLIASIFITIADMRD